MSEKLPYMVFSGTKSKYLAEKICAELGCPLGKLLFTKFADGEFAISYEESIRGRDIFPCTIHFPELRQPDGAPAYDRRGKTSFST